LVFKDRRRASYRVFSETHSYMSHNSTLSDTSSATLSLAPSPSSLGASESTNDPTIKTARRLAERSEVRLGARTE